MTEKTIRLQIEDGCLVRIEVEGAVRDVIRNAVDSAIENEPDSNIPGNQVCWESYLVGRLDDAGIKVGRSFKEENQVWAMLEAECEICWERGC